MKLCTDPAREISEEEAPTGIFVRAIRTSTGRVASVDIAELDEPSLLEFQRSRGGNNSLAEYCVRKILGHQLPAVMPCTDPLRENMHAGIHVRGIRASTCGLGMLDIAELDKGSLLRWLRSHDLAQGNPRAEDCVGMLLGHGPLHALEEEEPKVLTPVEDWMPFPERSSKSPMTLLAEKRRDWEPKKQSD